VSAADTGTRPFDVCGPLPTGVTVLEASAGTGKTYTIAALTARYIADGTPLDQVLLVTFTRMATGELRERVRERLVATEQGLRRALAGAPDATGDEVVALLASGTREEVTLRRDRLTRALADFDAATIATTHGFCQEVLGGLGVAGDVEPDTTLVEDVEDLLAEVVDDLYVRRFHRGETPDFGRDEALRIARVAVANPATPIEPADAPENTIEAMRRRLALAARTELDLRKRRMGVMTYDDLLTRLDDTLKGPGGPDAAARLAERYRVVLVDEFQDTDPIQWDIMRRAFGHGGVTLVLIGDPKQAIYAFRGADVYAYLEAAASAGAHATLDVNWRSDQGLIDAYDTLFGGAKLGHEGIVYRRVQAAEANRAPRLAGAPVDAPLRLRVVYRSEPSVAVTRGGYASNATARAFVAADLAADLVALLSSDATVEVRDEHGVAQRREPIRPGHVAVLVRTHRNAALVHEALAAVDVPAVINGAGSVFATSAARDWLRLLEAIERPASSPRARGVALTPFVGWSTEEVASAGEDRWEELHRRLHLWARVLREKGVASLTETITLVERLPGRVLRFADGERTLTDLRHVAQLLHAAATTEQLGTTALTSWLRARVAEDESGDEERSRRLESDDEAVQVLTIHRSKGLEFPVVYFPYLWEPGYIPRGEQPVFFHDPDNGDARTVDVGLGGVAFPRHQRQHEREQRGEDLRLAYVALTRAKHQAVVWWAGSYDSRNSPLGRLLFAREADGTVPPAGRVTPTDAAAVAKFEALAGETPGCISVERAAVSGLPVAWSAPLEPPGELAVARFDRRLDLWWRRTSYSGITAAAHEAWVASEPEQSGVDDEPPVDGPALPADRGEDAGAARLRAVASPWTDIPSNVHVGTFVHGVLEAAAFDAPDLEAELTARVADQHAARATDVGDLGVMAAALGAALETPLGPLVGGARLRDLARADRLDELGFELPLVGGDEPTGRLTLAAIAAVLERHAVPGDPVHGYAERLADPALRQDLRGYLTGSIDLVARVPGDDGVPRFVVVDYKTNRLGVFGEPLTAWEYRPAMLAAEMQRAHYVLQALLYAVALHRYLRWRVAGYDAELHLGGVAYLFLRGMTGAQTPEVDGTPCGVFAWRPSGALVAELSDVLDRGGAR
jgi:exodeoxyribonuclease V beta subunit